MSLEVYVLLKRSQVPTLAAWQGALDGLGFGLSLDPTFDPHIDTGFVPCKYNGSSTGFEFSLGTKTDLVEPYPDLGPRTELFDTSAAFLWGGDLNECVSAICSAAALTKVSAGLVYDPQEDQLFSGSEAVLEGQILGGKA